MAIITYNGVIPVMPDGKALIATGITPSGTKSITENGTYDVTQFASAAVNVAGSKHWNITITNDVFSGDIIFANDEDVAEHYADESAVAFLNKKTVLAVANTYPKLISSNKEYDSYFGVNLRYNAAATLLSSNAVSTSLMNDTASHSLVAKSNGDIGYIRASSSFGLAAGEYDLYFLW